MKVVFYLILLSLLLVGCASTNKGTSIKKEEPVVLQNDSQKETVHIEKIDTVYIVIPAQSSERTTIDSTSHLETDYSESDAWINSDGSLYHSLKNKVVSHPVPVPSTVDSIKTKETVSEPVYYPVKEEVERNFTWWEKFRMKSWFMITMIAVVSILWIFRKHLKRFMVLCFSKV